MWVRWNQGDSFSEPQPGPVDPFALQEVADWMMLDAVGGDLPHESGGPFTEPGEACEHWWTGLPSATANSPMPVPPAMTLPQAAWCEYRSCAPFCEIGTSVSSYSPHAAATSGPGLPADWLARETERGAIEDPDGIHEEDDLVLWRKYAVTRGSSGSAVATAQSMAEGEGYDSILSGLEPETRVRWVDGYARRSFQTRVASEFVEDARAAARFGQPLPLESLWALPVREGSVKDTRDLNGDGYPDLLLGGAGQLVNNVTGDSAVFSVEPEVPKDLAVSTAHMPWMYSLFDPESGDFVPMEAWDFDREHEWLMGPPDPNLPQDVNDPRLFGGDHGLEFLELWESTSSMAPALVSSGASASIGPSGPAAGASISAGPVSLSLSFTAGGVSPSVGVGPLSFSPGTMSLGPMQYDHATGDWFGGGAGFVIQKVIAKALETMEIPYTFGFFPDSSGGTFCMPAVGCDSISPKQQVRWARHLLRDMDGDGRPDLVIAHQPHWADEPQFADLDWVVLLNLGDGFGDPRPWPGVRTEYVEAHVTDGYLHSDGEAPAAQLAMRRGHQVAGLADMNGDGLPDFVYSRCTAAPTEPEEIPFLYLSGPTFGNRTIPGIDACWEEGRMRLLVKLNTGQGFAPDPVDWFAGDIPDQVVHVAGTYPALSSTRSHVQQSALYNDSWGIGIAGLRDWNGDGLVDYWAMSSGDFEDIGEVWDEDRHAVIFLNDGRRFVTDHPVTEDDRYGRVELLGPDSMSEQQFIPSLWAPILGYGPPQVALDVNKVFHQPGGSVVQTGVDDVDGDGRLDWFQAIGFETATPSLQLYPLQDQVPDLLVQVWEPGGATHSMEWAPARDFLDLPDDPNPRLLVDGSTLTDGEPDAFPASSQVLVGVRTLDGLGSLGGEALKTGLEYADPGYLHAFPLRRSTGFARVREALDGTISEQQWATDRHKAGLVELSLVSDDAGRTWSSTKTGWIHAPFDANYPPTGGPIGLNWHFAPADVLSRRYEHGSGGGGPLESRTLTSFEPRNGLAVCVQTDPDGDGFVDRVEWTDWDEDLLEDGRQDAANATGLLALPEDTFGFLTEEDCKRAPWAVHQLRHTFFDRFTSGRVETASVHDATGLTPAPLVESFGYTPDGQQVRHTDSAGADRWTLYDPIVGVYPVESHQPPNTVLGVAHVTRREVCGLGVPCAPAAHGLPAEVVDEAGLITWTSYDVQGRPVAVEDTLSSLSLDPDNPGPTTFAYQRPVRRVEVDELPEGIGAEGLPAVVVTSSPTGTPPLDLWGAPAGTPEPSDAGSVTTVAFVDGLGRPVMNRESWTDETGGPGWRVTGVARRDGRGRPVEVPWACFSAADVLDGASFVASFDPLASDLGTCMLPPPRQSFAYDPLDRAVTGIRPDGARVDSDFTIAGDEHVTRTTLTDPVWGLLSDVEERSSPFALRTLRRGAETWQHSSAGPWLGGPPVPDTDVLETVERRDAAGRRLQVERTGLGPADFTRFEWDGLDRLTSYVDPDQGDWTFDYDGAGRLQSRTLWKGASPELETWWSYDAQSRPVLEEHFANGMGGGLQLSEWVERSWDEDLAPYAPDVQPVAGGHVGRATSTAHGYVDPQTGNPVTDVVEGWRYDLRGRPVDRFVDLSGEPELAGMSFPTNLSAQYAWSDGGQRTRIWMPLDRERVSVELDSIGRAIGLVGESLAGDEREVLIDQAFDVLGRSRLLGFGNGTVQEFAYATGIHSDQALASVQVTQVEGSLLLGRQFSWDAAGNLRGWEDVGTDHFGPERFSCDYDGIGSLLGCSLDGGEEEVAYRYDALGNLIFEQVNLPGGISRTAGQYYRAGGALAASASPGYTPPLNSPVARVDVAPGSTEPASSLLYDPRGHLLMQLVQGDQQTWNGSARATEAGLVDAHTGLWQPVDVWRQLDWTAEGRLREVRVGVAGQPEQTGRFWWTSSGARVAHRSRPHSSEAGEEVTVLRFDDLLEITARALSGPDATSFYRLGSRLIAQRDHAPDLSTPEPDDLLFDRIRYFAGDHLGSATVITDEGDLSVGVLPEVVHAVRYEPYGRVREEAGVEARRPDYAESGVEELFNGKPRMRATFGLQGTELGLEGYDYGARLYLPQYGRWASADSITPDLVWEANPFAYVRNNPLKYVDPDGHTSLIMECESKNFLVRPFCYARMRHNGPIKGGLPVIILPAGGPLGASAAVVNLFRLITGGETAKQVVEEVGPDLSDLLPQQVPWSPSAPPADTPADPGSNGRMSGVPGDDFELGPDVEHPYRRPRGAGPTAEQRRAVQGQPCIDCGDVAPTQVADHTYPLVVEYYETGTNDTEAQRDPGAVRPHCPSCSNKQGGQLSGFSRRMKRELEKRVEEQQK